MNILLSTLNARYTHTALGLRYLYANMQHLKSQTSIAEYTINESIEDIAEDLLAHNPSIIGFGVYIWNAVQTKELLGILKSVAPHIILIVGGPEASYMPHRVSFEAAHYIIGGQADTAFFRLCDEIINNTASKERFIQAPIPKLDSLMLPYEAYSDEDIAHRYIYVEASRGCPFLCEFCLSSLDEKVARFDLKILLDAFEHLWQRGVRSFKFIDRTFNVNIKFANAILDFFLQKNPPYFLHFEVVPDHFNTSIKDKIAQFNPGTLQLEVGIQSLDQEVLHAISRPLNIQKTQENLTFLQQHTKAHMHVDLIIGLPKQSVKSFAKSLNTLMQFTQCEVQLGILKKLSGTHIARHDEDEQMVYNSNPPYDVLQTKHINFAMMQRLKRFARFWDIVYNSGNFKNSAVLLFENGDVFGGFLNFSDWVYTQTKATHKIALQRIAKLLFDYLTTHTTHQQKSIIDAFVKDFSTKERRNIPKFLHSAIGHTQQKVSPKSTNVLHKRQKKHLE